MERNQIPAVIHRVVPAGGERSVWTELWEQACLDAGWELRERVAGDLDDLDWKPGRSGPEDMSPRALFLSRLAVLWTFGGFVVPDESYPARGNLDKLRAVSGNGFVTSFDGPFAMCTPDFMGSPPRHGFLKALADRLDRTPPRLRGARSDPAEVLTELAEYSATDVRILPSRTANPALDTIDGPGNYIITQ